MRCTSLTVLEVNTASLSGRRTSMAAYDLEAEQMRQLVSELISNPLQARNCIPVTFAAQCAQFRLITQPCRPRLRSATSSRTASALGDASPRRSRYGPSTSAPGDGPYLGSTACIRIHPSQWIAPHRVLLALCPAVSRVGAASGPLSKCSHPVAASRRRIVLAPSPQLFDPHAHLRHAAVPATAIRLGMPSSPYSAKRPTPTPSPTP